MSDLATTLSATAASASPIPAPALGLVHGGPLTDFVKLAAGPLHLGNRITAAGLAADYLGLGAGPKNDAGANAVLAALLQFLLDRQRYVDAATLLWTPTMFSGEPAAVRRLWDAVFQNVFTMVPGAASMGKSYSLGVWLYLDWRRDPDFTNVQIVGPSERHLERNLFSHLVKLHNRGSIPAPGEVRQLEITTDPHQKDSGIFGVVIPIGKKAAGRLQGVKVVQRPTVHPQFGQLTRLRVMLEEAENIPVGIHDDVTNIISNARGVEQFKIVGPFNPKDPNSKCAELCEPVGGYGSIDIETSFEWESKRGCKVIRLDAYQSENVKEGRERFFGMQTKEGLDKAIMNAGGVGTPGYYTMARGWFPPQGVDLAVIAQHLMNDVVGEYQFVGTPKPCAAVDVALEGGDNAICALGRFGLSDGFFRSSGKGEREFMLFKDGRGRAIRFNVLQLDQLFLLPKGDTTKLVAEIRTVCSSAAVKGNHLGIDRAGNGAGTHDMLVSLVRTGVPIGINSGAGPTERRILEEDQKLPCDEYEDLLSEMWFALRKYVEYGFIKIHPNVATDPLFAEMTGRQVNLANKRKVKVESKAAYKSRGHRSPDRADAVTYLVHVVRLANEDIPSASREAAPDDFGPSVHRIGLTDRADRL